MIGGFFGFVFALFLCVAVPEISWWWLLWSSLIGMLIEVSIRLGCGESLGDAMCASIDIASSVGDFGDSGGGGGD
jgi:hypothetical protein